MKLKRILATTVSLVMITGILPATAFAGNARAADAVSYEDRSWDGSQVVSETKEVTEYIPISGLQPENGAIQLKNGNWYVSDQSFYNLSSPVNCSGEVNLILCDGSRLNIFNQGGIRVPEDATLNIYGQSEDSGTLFCSNRDKDYFAAIGGNNGEDCGNINIFGGSVEAVGGDQASGIGSGKDADMNGTIRVFGGTVSAKISNEMGQGVGIGAGLDGDMNGEVFIYGGDVSADGRDAAGIGAAGKGNMTGSVEIYSGTLIARCIERDYENTGMYGASIGTSVSSSSQLAGGEFTGSVKILGGTVTLTKGKNDSDTFVPAIGSAKDTTTGAIEIADDLCVKKGGTDAVLTEQRVTECRSLTNYGWLRIEKCNHANSSYKTISDTIHKRTCNSCCYEIEENHSFDLDGNCPCGFSLQGSGTHLAGYSLSLEGDIGVNFFVEFSESDIANNDPYVEFTIPSGSSSTTKKVYVNAKSGEERELARVDTTTVSGKTYYVFKCPVAAKEMTSEITAHVVYDDSEGKEYKYCVKDYADYILNNAQSVPAYEEAVPLVKALLNYGAYSQKYFGTNTNKLANADLGPNEKGPWSFAISHTDYVISNLPDGVSFEGTSIYLKSGTTLSLYFKNKSGNDVTFKLGNKVLEAKENKGFIQIDITDIKANELLNDFTITVGESGSVTYGPMNYCKSILAGSGSEELKGVVRALYRYAEAANNYGGNNA